MEPHKTDVYLHYHLIDKIIYYNNIIKPYSKQRGEYTHAGRTYFHKGTITSQSS